MPIKQDSVAKDSVTAAQATDHSDFIEDFVKGLKDEGMMTAKLGAIFDTRLKAAVAALKEENACLSRDLQAVTDPVELSEAHDQKSNLFIAGLLQPVSSWSEAVSMTSHDKHGHTPEHIKMTEKAVLELITTCLQVPLTSQDISIAHRLKKKKNSDLGPIIVQFTNYKIRDAVCRARFKLKGSYGNSTTSQHSVRQ